MNIILLGAPGAGKGTQAVRIAKSFNIPHISTGDIFRKNIKEGTPVGLKAKSYIDRGELVPDSVTVEIVKNRLAEPDCVNGWLLDGFPRNAMQAEELDKIANVERVINISADLKRLTERLTGRRVCDKCGESYHITTKTGEACDVAGCGGKLYQRADDNVDTVSSRLTVYEKQTAPLIDYYTTQGKLFSADGMQPIDDVYADIVKLLK